MPQLIVLSAIGTDRPGVVKDISKAIYDCGGNIEESRMSALGAEFAILMLISGNWHTPAKLEKAMADLEKYHELVITLKKTEVLQTAIFGFVLLGERLSGITILGILIGFAAVMFLSDTGGGVAAKLLRRPDKTAALGLLSGGLVRYFRGQLSRSEPVA